jgi:hypothetical protein
MEKTLIDLHRLEIRDPQATFVTWQGRETLRLENGMAQMSDSMVKEGSIEVLIGTEGPAYAGVAFRLTDILNFELAYAVPHVSGQWDVLQYDPVFHGSNTWQLYHGPGYQQTAQVPTGRWFKLKIDYCDNRAAISVDGQPSLVVDRLAHAEVPGQFGLWAYLPSYFSDLSISSCEGVMTPRAETPGIAAGIVASWFIEGFGVVACEPNGVVNLNRYLPLSVEKVRLVRRFETTQDREVTFEFGFSDVLSLQLDGEVIYEGENTFSGFADRAARGYAELGLGSVARILPPGRHELVAELAVSEGFGWGLVLAADGEEMRWLPAELG